MLYCISDHPSNRYQYVVMDHDYYTQSSASCDVCGRTVQSCQLVYWPPRMRLEGGKRFPDCLSVSVPFADKCGLIVSERALAVFQKEGITGFEAAPIEFHDTGTKPDGVPQYYYLSVKGTVSLDYGAMHYRKKNVCPACGGFHWSRQKVGVSVLDEASWDQCDLCKLADYPNIVLCTQKVIDVIRANSLKGFTKRADTEIFLPLKAVKICS